ncbi:MAG: hypothetical protein EOO77_35305 [Oxalobacteraceae bacterium]|nr:MAG: hypothetical protein EOO77_35305 [Oxalobacteraceae bacterium]
MPKAHAIVTALQIGAALALTACSRQPEATSQPSQPDTVVTSRSDGKAIPNPRRGSFAKSKPGKYGYTSPEDFHKTTAEPRSTYTQ